MLNFALVQDSLDQFNTYTVHFFLSNHDAIFCGKFKNKLRTMPGSAEMETGWADRPIGLPVGRNIVQILLSWN